MPTKENKVVEILGLCPKGFKELYLGWKHTEINRTKIKIIRYKIYGR